MRQDQPIVRDVVLLGGGHTHVIVVRKWAMNPIPGVRLTLISEDPVTPYSGMLPGLVAGHYSFEETHIDLPRLCAWSGARFIAERATGVEPDDNRVLLSGRPAVEYDVLSIDTGGAPRLANVEGAIDYTTPVKPVSGFYARWRQIEQRYVATDTLLKIAVVGAGAGGFEIAMAVNFRLANLRQERELAPFSIHWIVRTGVLPDFPRKISGFAEKASEQTGVTIHRDFDVNKVTAEGLESASGKTLDSTEVLWCTEAQASAWPAASGLACDDHGFLQLHNTLQSLSHENVFAAGDVAVQVNQPRPRAGVFAVRQGPVLYQNLQRFVLQQPLKQHAPQTRFLTLLSTGAKHAIANKGPLSVAGAWVWRWKNHIDQKFMQRFNRLPAMDSIAAKHNETLPTVLQKALGVSVDHSRMRCGGCGAKVASDILSETLSQLSILERTDQVSGVREGDDVAIIRPQQELLAQSVDQIRAMISDPVQFGRIATLHALSDLYAAGAIPQSAMLIGSLPYAADQIVRRDLEQLMHGVSKTLGESGCTLSGGHTSEAAELSLGFVVNGYLESDAGHGAIPTAGNLVVLTKGIGTGVVLAAHMRGLAKASEITDTLDSMLMSNAAASDIVREHLAGLVTDVTGFGLAGHLGRLLSETDLRCQLDVNAVPVLEGVKRLSSDGVTSTLFTANVRATQPIMLPITEAAKNIRVIFDPQTSGGLLGIIPADQAEHCIAALRESGYRQAAIIGKLAAKDKGSPTIELVSS